jgi:nitrogen fixation protein FixH
MGSPASKSSYYLVRINDPYFCICFQFKFYLLNLKNIFMSKDTEQNSRASSLQKGKSGFNPWPYAITGFLLFIICFNIWFGITASKGTLPNVEKQTYEKGLEYQKVIDRLNQSRELGWKVEILADITAEKIVLKLSDKDNNQLDFDSAVLKLIRPNDASKDKEISFSGPEAEAKALSSGLWLYEVIVKKGSSEFFAKDNIVL